MFSFLQATSLLLVSLFSLVSAQTVDASNCTTGLHIIVARASGEAPGEGIIGVVAQNVVGQIPGSDSVAVVYPATLGAYVQSEGNGTSAMNLLIQQYAASCPNSKFALMGYSQGAHVVGDVLCGTSEPGWPVTSAMYSNYSANFVASVQMGDPSYVPGQSYDNGTSQVSGIFNRTNPSGCAPYESRMVSFCDTGDFFCAKGKGSNAIAIHLSYVNTYGGDATQFVIDKYHAAVNGTSGSSSTSTAASSTATSSASTTSGASSTTTEASTTSGGSTVSTITSAATPTTTSGAGRTMSSIFGLVASLAFAAVLMGIL